MRSLLFGIVRLASLVPLVLPAHGTAHTFRPLVVGLPART
jgi:hypothetical protein